MRVKYLLLSTLLGAIAFSAAAYAVAIGLTSTDIDQLGGTGNVDVLCPANPCQITRVKWVLTSSAPYLVDRVLVEWQTRETTGATYTVYVTLLDSSNAVIAGGSATQAAHNTAVTTNVDITPNVDPAQVYRVNIVIVQN
jgi:hypothetical protein